MKLIDKAAPVSAMTSIGMTGQPSLSNRAEPAAFLQQNDKGDTSNLFWTLDGIADKMGGKQSKTGVTEQDKYSRPSTPPRPAQLI